MKTEVRCCCDPTKLLGWMDVPDGAERVQFPMIERIPRWEFTFDKPTLFPDGVSRLKTLTLEVGTCRLSDGREIRAINSKDIPLETLKRIRGFIPA